jgi:predicted transcriptional regulator
VIFATLVLYTRLIESDILGHDLRRAIVRAVSEHPGQSVAELARMHGVDPKTIVHHLRMLERAHRVHPVSVGRARRWFAPGAPPDAKPPPRFVRALEALRAGARSPAELARALGIPRGTAGGLLRGLARLGLARKDPDAWRVSPQGDEALCREPGLGET